MPKKCIKFISEFLIPSLNEEKFGNRLTWLDKEKKIFQIDWYHKGGPRWTEREAQVFVEWDKHKGHYHPEEKSYFTKSKQRFRALLYKLTSDGKIIPQQSRDKFIKVYSIGEKEMKRRKRSSSSTSDNSEYEMFESCPLGMNDRDFEEEYRRKVLDDSTKNILEDHSYTSVDYQSGIETDHVVESCLMNIPNLDSFQELIDISPERSLVKWNNSFDGTNNSLISQQKSLISTSEKVLVKFNYPYSECNDSLALMQESIEDQSKKVLLKLNYPHIELDDNPSINSADLFLTPKVFPSTDLNLDFL